MTAYDGYIEQLEGGLLDLGSLSEEALEAGADALAFAEGLNDMFRSQGLDLPETPDLFKLEGVIEGYVGELAAAVMLLSNAQLGRTPEALENLHREIGQQVPDSVATGFLRLADRVRKTRVAQQHLLSRA